MRVAIMLLIVTMASAQTNMGPVRTPQINSVLYVGQSGYATIQSAVTFACKTGNQSYIVAILAGVAPADSPTTVTSGCSGTYISDFRTEKMRNYRWNGSAYVSADVEIGGNLQVDGTSTLTGNVTSPAMITGGVVRANVSGIAQANPDMAYMEYVHPLNQGRFAAAGPDSSTVAGLRLDGLSSNFSQDVVYMTCTAAGGCIFPGNVNIAGSLSANLGAGSMLNNSPICTEATGCPGTNVTYPPAGIGVSTGSAWSENSIDPSTLAFTTSDLVKFAGSVQSTRATYLPSGTDLNTVDICGTFEVDGGVNIPPLDGVGNQLGVHVICGSGSSRYVLQLAWHLPWFPSSDQLYYRVSAPSAGSILPHPDLWSNWRLISTTVAVSSLSSFPLTRSGQKSNVTPSTPTTSHQRCRKDAMWHDEGYIYVCVKNGEVKRAALSPF